MMMMIGEQLRRTHHPTVQIPSWEPYDDSITDPSPHHRLSPSSSSSHYYPIPSTDYSSPTDFSSPSSFAADYATALNLYTTSFSNDYTTTTTPESDDSDSSVPYDSFSCDEFRIYEFKVRRCIRGRSHDWTECPFAHPGEKARRRDPRRYSYSGVACPEFRKGSCKKGDGCEFAHGVFECWLHPMRYRTQPCKDGVSCVRRVCFFAHSAEQLRVLPVEVKREMIVTGSEVEVSTPPGTPRGEYGEVEELVGGMMGLQMSGGGSPGVCWGFQLGSGGGYGSPGGGLGVGRLSSFSKSNRGGCGPGVCSSVGGLFDDSWNLSLKEEPVMERVESGRDIRARMYAKLRRENSLDRSESTCSVPDVGWVSELVK